MGKISKFIAFSEYMNFQLNWDGPQPDQGLFNNYTAMGTGDLFLVCHKKELNFASKKKPAVTNLAYLDQEKTV